MGIIEGIFSNFVNSEEYAKLGDIPEAKAEQDKLCDLFESMLTRNELSKVAEPVKDFAGAFEMQGFIFGFRHAVKMFKECIDGVGV